MPIIFADECGKNLLYLLRFLKASANEHACLLHSIETKFDIYIYNVQKMVP